MSNLFAQLSTALADHVEQASARVVALQMRHGRHLTATRWQDDLIVASDQTLPRREVFPARLADGSETEAAVIGRDEATNIALLKLSAAPALDAPVAGQLRTGGLALTVGARKDAAATACLGVVNQVGPAWQSSHGGRIDAYIRLDLGISQSEEGGPVIAPDDGIVGITTFGPRGQVLVIPHATIARVVPQLLTGGRVARGWIGAALQPVAVPEVEGEHQGRGFMVMSVNEGGPAAKGGVVPGDIVTAFAGERVGRVSQLAKWLGPDSVGNALDLRILRGGAVHTVSLTVQERPEAA